MATATSSSSTTTTTTTTGIDDMKLIEKQIEILISRYISPYIKYYVKLRQLYPKYTYMDYILQIYETCFTLYHHDPSKKPIILKDLVQFMWFHHQTPSHTQVLKIEEYSRFLRDIHTRFTVPKYYSQRERLMISSLGTLPPPFATISSSSNIVVNTTPPPPLSTLNNTNTLPHSFLQALSSSTSSSTTTTIVKQEEELKYPNDPVEPDEPAAIDLTLKEDSSALEALSIQELGTIAATRNSAYELAISNCQALQGYITRLKDLLNKVEQVDMLTASKNLSRRRKAAFEINQLISKRIKLKEQEQEEVAVTK